MSPARRTVDSCASVPTSTRPIRLAEAAAREADVVQFFLTDPQGYDSPVPRDDADTLRAAEVDVYVHAPYLINVATLNNRIRIPSRKLLACTCRRQPPRSARRA